MSHLLTPGNSQSIAPLLILLRVAQQSAWTRNTLKQRTVNTQLDIVTITSTTQTDASRTRVFPLTDSRIKLPKSSFTDSLEV